MGRKVEVREPVGRGFWDPWAIEEVRRPPSRSTEFKRICVICLSEIAERAPTIQCPHCGALGHHSCFEDWITLKGICPLCRRPLSL